MKTLMRIAGVVAVLTGAAFAYPDGAPWGADDLNGAESCATCHFDFEPEALWEDPQKIVFLLDPITF